MKHNPGFLSDDELVEGFVVRGSELDALLDVLREEPGPTNQHLLIIARRGMGKTMLVNRLVVEVRRTPELAQRWVPIVFGEEAYNVATAGELWLEALFHVAEQTGEQRWRDIHEALLDERDDARMREAALARLLDFADARGGRLLIVVENLQDILGAQMSDEEGWVLRHTLLNEPRIMLLATATSRFDEIDQPKKAAYELFRVLELERLDTEECRELWWRVAGEKLEGRAIRPVEIFTGGNLRLVTVLAQFSAGRSFRSFSRELLGLLDDHSDYFKSNIEALPLDERRVFTGLCDLWEPSLARDVARGARFSVNKTSMLLGRLERRGAIETVGKRGRAKLYEVSERLYNLYHLLRRRGSRDSRVAGLIEFMIRYYSTERLQELAQWIADEACRLTPSSRHDNMVALRALIERLGLGADAMKVVESLPAAFWELPEVDEQPLLSRLRESVRLSVATTALTQAVLGVDNATVREFLDVFDRYGAGQATDDDILGALERASRSPVTVAGLVAGAATHNVELALQLLRVLTQAREPTFGLVVGLLILAQSGVVPSASFERLVRGTLEIARGRSSFIIVPIACSVLIHQDAPSLQLAAELDREFAARHAPSQVLLPYHIALALHESGPDAAMDVARALVARDALDARVVDPGIRRPIVDLAAVRPEQMHALLADVPAVAPITVALAMDLGLQFNAPREVVEVAKDVLADIRACRESPRYEVKEPPIRAAAEGDD